MECSDRHQAWLDPDIQWYHQNLFILFYIFVVLGFAHYEFGFILWFYLVGLGGEGYYT